MNTVLREIKRKELEILECRVWGTLGPHSISAAVTLRDITGFGYGLMCHSGGTAYDSMLRAYGACRGKAVITSPVSSPINSLEPICVGAHPVFCGKDIAGTLAGTIEKCGAENVSAVVLDYIAAEEDSEAQTVEPDKIYGICGKYGVPFIINAGGNIAAKYKGAPLSEFCDAAFYSLTDGSMINCGCGGFAALNSQEKYSLTGAFHNCGRAPGIDAADVEYQYICGGDARVTEWTSAVAEIKVSEGAFDRLTPRVMKYMPDMPVFRTKYFEKMTGVKFTDIL